MAVRYVERENKQVFETYLGAASMSSRGANKKVTLICFRTTASGVGFRVRVI